MSLRQDLAVGVGLAVLLTGPAVLRGELVGSPRAEVYGHAWVQGWAAQAWPSLPAGTDLALGTARWPVIDPLPTWLCAGLASAVGPVAAWNAWAFAGIVLAAVGGGALVRAGGGVGAVGAVGLPLASIVLGSLQSGLTEDGGIGLVALGLAALLQGRALRGGALLGLAAGFGLYLGWLGGIAALGVGIARVLGLSGGPSGGLRAGLRELPRLGAGGLVALSLGLLFARPFAERLAGPSGDRAPAQAEPLWPLNPWRGADLASYVIPGRPTVDATMIREHPAYLGWSALALAAAGGGGPAWLGLGLAVATAPGETLSWRGEVLGPNPFAALLHVIPYADRLHNHARILLVGQMALLVLAGRGAGRLPRLGPLLVLGEQLLLSPAAIPLDGTPSESPRIYAALAALPPGPVQVVPASGPGVHPQKVFYDQRAHGRRLLHDPNRPTRPGRPPAGTILVVLDGSTPAGLGPPDAETPDGRAWVVR